MYLSFISVSSGRLETLGKIKTPGDFLFQVNPEDAGRFTNHSSVPNMGFEGALKDVSEGEELVMDYSFHGDPELWQHCFQQLKFEEFLQFQKMFTVKYCKHTVHTVTVAKETVPRTCFSMSWNLSIL